MDGSVSAFVQRGLLLKEQGRFEEAAQYFRDALAEDPENPLALSQLAACQVHLPTEQRQALHTIDRAIAIDPEDASHHELKAFILCVLQRPHDALRAVRAALELDPISAIAFSAQAQAYLQLERWRDAEEAARRALSYDADSSVVSNQLAQALMMQNKMSEHDAHIATLLARDPENPYSHSNAGWALLKRGEYRRAQQHFLEALRIDPNCEYARMGLIEAFKARSPVYRLYIRYCSAMARLSRGSRFIVVIGLYLAVRCAHALFTGRYAPLGMMVVIAYFLFAMWTWVARGVGNALLLVDPFARHALRAGEAIEGMVVGGTLFLGAMLLAAGIGSGLQPLVLAGGMLIASAFPFAVTFTNQSKIGAWCYGVCGALAVLAATGIVVERLLLHGAAAGAMTSFASIVLTVVLFSTWLGAFNVMRK